jgi:hypothetical protein
MSRTNPLVLLAAFLVGLYILSRNTSSTQDTRFTRAIVPSLQCGSTKPRSCRVGAYKYPKEARLDYALHGLENVEGWMAPVNAYLAMRLSDYQRQLGICGSVAEIGVHHGLFNLAITHTLSSAEQLAIVDVFEDQHKNVDKSGKGDQSIYFRNMAKYGVPREDVNVFQESSDRVKVRCSFKG